MKSPRATTGDDIVPSHRASASWTLRPSPRDTLEPPNGQQTLVVFFLSFLYLELTVGLAHDPDLFLFFFRTQGIFHTFPYQERYQCQPKWLEVIALCSGHQSQVPTRSLTKCPDHDHHNHNYPLLMHQGSNTWYTFLTCHVILYCCKIDNLIPNIHICITYSILWHSLDMILLEALLLKQTVQCTFSLNIS